MKFENFRTSSTETIKKKEKWNGFSKKERQRLRGRKIDRTFTRPTYETKTRVQMPDEEITLHLW